MKRIAHLAQVGTLVGKIWKFQQMEFDSESQNSFFGPKQTPRSHLQYKILLSSHSLNKAHPSSSINKIADSDKSSVLWHIVQPIGSRSARLPIYMQFILQFCVLFYQEKFAKLN